MAKTKRFSFEYSTPGITAYAVVIQVDTGKYLDDADGGFSAAPADKYHEVAEDAVLPGRYVYTESRTVWADGPYEIIIYRQAGASPDPAADTAINSAGFTIQWDSVPSAGAQAIGGLCSLDDVKAVLKVTGSSLDVALTAKIVAAESFFQEQTGYTLVNTEHTEYFSPGARDMRVLAMSRLLVKEHPIISVTSLWQDDARAWTDADDEIPASDFFFDDYGVELFSNGGTPGFFPGQRTVRLIYRAGYASVPGFLRNAVAHYAAWIYYQDEPGKMRSAIASESMGDASVTYLNEEAPKIAMAAIRLLKRPCGL